MKQKHRFPDKSRVELWLSESLVSINTFLDPFHRQSGLRMSHGLCAYSVTGVLVLITKGIFKNCHSFYNSDLNDCNQPHGTSCRCPTGQALHKHQLLINDRFATFIQDRSSKPSNFFGQLTALRCRQSAKKKLRQRC